MPNITHEDPVVTESKLTEFYEDIKPFLGCPAYVTQEGDAEYYSTDEKVIGRWIDGKPLYQKTWQISSPNNDWTPTRMSDWDIFDVAFVISTFGIRANNSFISIPYYESANNFATVPMIYRSPGSADTYVYFKIGSNNFNVATLIITIQYTKSTDSATTTIETKPTHYSTDEQMVGTWIDGKPLYQRTVIYPNSITVSTTQTWTKITDITDWNIDRMIDISGTIQWAEMTVHVPFIVNISGSPDITFDFFLNNYKTELGARHYRNSGSTIASDICVTVQYTKTTD